MKGTHKYRFYPTIDQQIILNNWINSSRYTYNQTIHKIENEKQKINFYNLRDKLVPKKKIIKSKKWLLDTPKEVRAYSVKEAVAMYSSAFSNLKNGNIHKFKMKYRSKKKTITESITIPHASTKLSENKKELRIYKTFLNSPLKMSHPIDIEIKKDFKILHHKKCNVWYFCIPIDYNVIPDSQGDIVAIDPGVKTFQTLYDQNGNVTQFGSNDMKNKLVVLYKKIDKYKSLKSNSTGRTKRNLTKHISKMYLKFKNLIHEIHNKTCRYIYTNYNNVLISNIGKIKGHLRDNNRKLLSWQHGKFIERLTYHMHKNGKKINIITEEYTSKTCGNCGWLDNNLSNKNIYKCRDCGLIINRDINGARCIMLKHLK